jgi:SAM-dependent methyltransferase
MGLPAQDAIATAAAASPLIRAEGLSDMADMDELRYRDELEAYPQPRADIPRFIDAKELPRRLDYALAHADLSPDGVVVELGAGSCWLAACLARRPGVQRVVAVEFSARRLVDLAPIAIAHLDAPPEKIERRVADFYAHGLAPASADWVFTDAAFHHARDPVALGRVAFDLLRPGGRFVLMREPTLSLLRRHRDHGEEGRHGGFEREYDARGYLRHLRAAGFEARAAPASGGWRTARARALHHPPVSWLNGVLFSEYTYVGVRP